jgi:hypothetical protein
MSQKYIKDPTAAVAQKGYENVSESCVLYDTVLLGAGTPSLIANDGYFTSFAAMGGANSIPFFNIRNRNHGLAYNNQDTRDQLPYVMKIYSVGVSFWGPSTSTYRNNVGTAVAPQRTALDLWETELPKHMSLTLQTNQDDRLKIASLLCPPGYGVMVSGVSQGDVETAYGYPNIAKVGWTQGIPELTNKWGFRIPLKVPRTANLSVRLDISEYGRQMLQAMPGPFSQFFKDPEILEPVPKDAMCGIQVTIGGIREVQQRGQLHA